jgi:hypothetical protein
VVVVYPLEKIDPGQLLSLFELNFLGQRHLNEVSHYLGDNILWDLFFISVLVDELDKDFGQFSLEKVEEIFPEKFKSPLTKTKSFGVPVVLISVYRQEELLHPT